MNSDRERGGFTLTEILVVIAIVLTLVGILAAVVWPRAKESARITQNGQQLKQVALAINIYMQDHDDQPPLRLEGIATDEIIRDPVTCVRYFYKLVPGQVLISRKSAQQFGFDWSADAVVVCPSCSRHKGDFDVMEYPCPDGRMSHYRVPLLDVGEKNYVLGARIDGSVGYFQEPPEWQKNLPPLPDAPGSR
jgi:type II secretory pathway pseudopilin PulG